MLLNLIAITAFSKEVCKVSLVSVADVASWADVFSMGSFSVILAISCWNRNVNMPASPDNAVSELHLQLEFISEVDLTRVHGTVLTAVLWLMASLARHTIVSEITTSTNALVQSCLSALAAVNAVGFHCQVPIATSFPP